MVVLGPTSRGGFACFPDFNIGRHLVNLKDKFGNTEKLVEVLGKADGLTVAIISIVFPLIVIEPWSRLPSAANFKIASCFPIGRFMMTL
jgi:hypothetical protein